MHVIYSGMNFRYVIDGLNRSDDQGDWTELTRRLVAFINTYVLFKLAFIPTISPNDFFNMGLELPDVLSVGPELFSF